MADRRGKPADPARLAAYDVLRTVAEQDAYTNLVLPPLLRSRGIRDRDAAFATELVSGTIRRRGTYDAVLAANIDRQLGQVDPGVLDALRLGCHQVLSMRVPSHAAVGTTVDVVRARVGHRPAGFVNAVLRKVAAHDLEGWVRRLAPDPATDPVGYAALAHAHPRWVVEAFGEALAAAGAEAELDELLEADNDAPRVSLVARPGLATPDELLAAAEGAERGRSPWAVTMAGGDPGELAAVREGRAGVQDEGSQLVALALTEAAVEPVEPQHGAPMERWLDLCAGPGGKAALLAAVAAGRGARLLASERQPHRAELVRSGTRAARAGLLGVIAADGTRPAWRAGAFDRVLVDAPCSGLGALRRRPEARWRKTRGDLTALVALQRRLLKSALDAVRPGGVVLYATCSPVLAETAGVVTSVLESRPDAEIEDVGPLLAGLGIEPGTAATAMPGTAQLWPHRHGTDAMFLALLRKR
jgi:16S rRNA (cytosine967-C5)-methyltransferase